jgi:nucleoid-associated protein YgaU
MSLFDGGKKAEEAKKLAEEEVKKARMAEAKAQLAVNKVGQVASQATARAEKAEKELKDMKAAKAREVIIAGQKAGGGIAGIGIPGMRHGATAPMGAKIIASYTVKKGDTLGQIAKNFYGVTGPKYWNLIQAANKDLIKDVNVISVGQVFKIPELPIELKK